MCTSKTTQIEMANDELRRLMKRNKETTIITWGLLWVPWWMAELLTLWQNHLVGLRVTLIAFVDEYASCMNTCWASYRTTSWPTERLQVHVEYYLCFLCFLLQLWSYGWHVSTLTVNGRIFGWLCFCFMVHSCERHLHPW